MVAASSRSATPRVALTLAVANALALSACSGAEPGAGERTAVVRSALGAGTFEAVPAFGDNPGALKMFRYLPAVEPPGPAALVLALHACTQNATSYRNAGWESLADEFGFYVIYPEQQLANNGAGCFNWAGEFGDPTNLTRGAGENQSIISMVDQMKRDVAIDDGRVFVMGHSGGGAMTALLMATWPEVFAGAGILAGIPYNCTTTFAEVSGCLTPGKDRTPEAWGALARQGHPAFEGTYPRLSIWHGEADAVVSPSNQRELLEQWSAAMGIDQTADAEGVIDGHARAEYHDGEGNVAIETVTVTGGDHATFVVPGEGCGSEGAFFSDRGICAARRLAEFWQLTSGVVEPAGSGGSGAGASSSAGAAAGGGRLSPGVDGSCAPGQEIACACSDGESGSQICSDDGRRFDDCSCDGGCAASAATMSRPGRGYRGAPAVALLLCALGAARRGRRAHHDG